MTQEIWKSIPGYEELYEVSTYGSVRSKYRVLFYRDRINVHKPTLLKFDQSLNRGGKVKGLRVTLSKDNIQERFSVHSLVMLTFVGPTPEGKEIAHNDGNPLNNHLENLRYATHTENEADKKIHGTLHHGKEHHRHLNCYVVIDPSGIEHRIESPTKFFIELMGDNEEARRFRSHVCDPSRLKNGTRSKHSYHGWVLKEFIKGDGKSK